MIVMSIALSEQCNLNCTYCNVDKLSKKRIDPELFLQQYRKKKAEHPNEKFQIDFFGGEPLLQWDLVQTITEEIKNDGNILFMPTNGLLLNQERVDYLVGNKFRVSLSFDGLWQDLNRPQHNSTGSLKHYIEKRDLFKQIPELECHTMVAQGNYNLLENHLFINELLGLNPDLTLVRDVGIWDQEAVEKFNAGFTELVNWYIANADSVEVPGLINHYLYHIILYTSKRVRVDFCGAGDHYFSFSENKLIPCNRFKDDDRMIAKIPEYKLMKECETCDVKNYCKKGCLFENIKNEGPIVELCDIYKHIYSELIRMVKELNSNSTFREYMQREINDA